MQIFLTNFTIYSVAFSNDNGTVIIKGGTFSSDPTNYLARGYTATK